MKLFNVVIITIIMLVSSDDVFSAPNNEVRQLVLTCQELEKVDLTTFDKVEKLVVKNCDLKAIPTKIYTLKNLTHLDLANNQIEKVDQKLNVLTKLQSLNLRNNLINDFDEITNLTNLEYLDLSGNNLFKTTSIKNFTKLKKLNLSYNGLNYIVDLEGLKNLKTVDFSYNQLVKLPKLNNNIKKLDVTNNYLDLKNNCCKQYQGAIVKQNKIQIRDDITDQEIAKAILNSKYIEDLLESSDGSAVVGFNSYELKFKIGNKVYTVKELINNYNKIKSNDSSLIVDVGMYDNYIHSVSKERVVNRRTIVNYIMNNFTTTNSDLNIDVIEVIEKIKKDDNTEYTRDLNRDEYFTSQAYKTLSILICVIFIVPVIVIILIFIYLNSLNNGIKKVVDNQRGDENV
ncbi:leucine-rich repeat domain-containing protein [Erysipelotrichaceae bacterium OttesenSCG-928-M19]|nr:leucine-rich repeat domain-containing protein [Erysipelotrichaceae bacterium OttesenSCG-928-M19]